MGVVIIIPWPSRDLHPNSRVHWRRVRAAAKKAREIAGWAAIEAGARAIRAERLHVALTFIPPDKRARDLDGMLSNVKSHLDGIADVIGVDDSKWEISMSREGARKGGLVRIEISEAA